MLLPSIYLITDDLRSKGRPVEEIVEAAVKGGVRMLQYRPLNIPDHEFISTSKTLREITYGHDCKLLINKRIDIALACKADGVQLGRSGISVAEAKIILKGGIIGYSAHNPEEAVKAQEEGVDFVTFSPVFPTTSSSLKRNPIGLEPVAALAARLTIPLFPLGGIRLEHIELLKKNGLSRAAVVTAITEADDVETASRKIIFAIEE